MNERKSKTQSTFAYKNTYISPQYLCKLWARYKSQIVNRKIFLAGKTQNKQVFYFD